MRPFFHSLALIALLPHAGLAADCMSDEDDPIATRAQVAGTRALENASSPDVIALVRVRVDHTPETFLVSLPSSEKSLGLSKSVLDFTRGAKDIYVVNPRKSGNIYLMPYSPAEMSSQFSAKKACPAALRGNRAMRSHCSIVDFSGLREKGTFLYGAAGEHCDEIATFAGGEIEELKVYASTIKVLNDLFRVKTVGPNRAPADPFQSNQTVKPGPKAFPLGSAQRDSTLKSEKKSFSGN